MDNKNYNILVSFRKMLSGSVAFLAILLSLVSTFSCSPVSDEGKIKKFFFLNEESQPQLTVWFSSSKGGGRSVPRYKETLKAYDLQTGKILGSVVMSKALHYRFYASDHNKAWGYCKQAGLQLLDLVKPGIIATEQEFLEHNPQLGKKVKLYLKNAYDPLTNSLHVAAADDQVYRLDANLKTTAIDRVPERTSPEEQGWVFAKNWHFYSLDHHPGKHLHREKAECSAKSVTLLGPKLIKEFNKNIRQKDRVWVIHRTAIIGEYDLLLSLVIPNGEEFIRLNLQKIFKEKSPGILGTYTGEKEVLIFFASGIHFKNNIEGFAFIALRTDSESGEFLGQINYF